MADNPIAIGFRWILQHLSPRYLSLIAVLTAAFLFVPSTFLAAVGLDTMAAKYRPGIALIFFCSSFLLVTYVVEHFTKPMFERRRARKQIEACLDTLGTDEILVLQKFVESGKNSLSFSPMDGTVQRLVDAGILYRSTQFGSAYGFGYSITPLAIRYLDRKKLQERLLRLSAKR